MVLGLFSPFKFELPQYKGYDITRFKDNIRFLKIYINRDGEMGGVCPLFFDGAVCHFEELPRPEDKTKMDRVYEYLKTLRGENTVSKTFFTYGIKNFNLKYKKIKSLKQKYGKCSNAFRKKWYW